MNTILENYNQAQLSLAAYALNLEIGAFGSDDEGYVAALTAAPEMSVIQAKEFANNYKVIDQYTDPDSGFSGTIFEKAGKKYFAIRGTEGLLSYTDWVTNIADVLADGIAIDQGISMLNWIQQLYTDPSQPDQLVQYEYRKEVVTGTEVTTAASIESTSSSNITPSFGLLFNQATSLTVAGHSLGGQLAIMLSRIAPSIVSSVYTYNPPGFDEIPQEFLSSALTSSGFFNALQNTFATPVTGSVGSNWDAGIIENFVVASDKVHLLGTLPGTPTTLYSEGNNDGFIDSHTLPNIVDALAVAALFEGISPNIQINTLNAIFEASSNDNWTTLERTVESLYSLFTPGQPIRVAEGDREDLYKYIGELKPLITSNKNSSAELFNLADYGNDAAAIENKAKNKYCVPLCTQKPRFLCYFK